MSTISTSDSSLREQPTKEVTWTDSCLRKKTNVISKLRHYIQQKNTEIGTSLFRESIFKYPRTFEASRKELYEWYTPRKACKAVRKYPSRFKQKVINEILSGERKSYVAEKYRISYKTLMNWVDKACEAIPEINAPLKKKKYSLDFKQKVINEIRLNKCKTHVAEKYGLSYQTLRDWTKKACNLPKIKKNSKRKVYPFDFKQKVISEVRLGMCKVHAAEKYQLCYRTLVDWLRRARLSAKPTPIIEEPLEEEKYSLDFKQKVVSEVCSSQHISQVCKNHNIGQNTLNIWLKQAYSPNFPYNSSAAWTDKS